MAPSSLCSYRNVAPDGTHQREQSFFSQAGSSGLTFRNVTPLEYSTMSSDAKSIRELSSSSAGYLFDAYCKEEISSVSEYDSSDSGDELSPRSLADSCSNSSWARLGTAKDSLHVDEWVGKRGGLAIQDDLSDTKKKSMLHFLGRSVSDCNPLPASAKNKLLSRSSSTIAEGSARLIERTDIRNVTDDDFEELKGFIDLGFCFNETSHLSLGHTIPALEVYCAVAQNLQESPHNPMQGPSSAKSCSSISPTSHWKVSNPGDFSYV
ncbi:hypothetical protein KP509_30G018800 [Ceratopteris richardii]|uniref:Uncharacterized protein n=1 Tax=Ceratopteris richardii TaxID=49495 RepID=A0A8T2R155_CERRI|nr:hypothetical protein KP509_30G018800 [Ceratopteris richardii]